MFAGGYFYFESLQHRRRPLPSALLFGNPAPFRDPAGESGCVVVVLVAEGAFILKSFVSAHRVAGLKERLRLDKESGGCL